MTEKRYQVFVSSTYSDLIEERQREIYSLMLMDCFASSMEYFPATTEEQLAFIEKIIDDCDYYLLIIGDKYGSLHSSGVSFTEKEYDYAIKQGKTVCAFFHKAPEQLPDEKREQDPLLRKALEDFSKKVKADRVVGSWVNPDDLAHQVVHSLLRTMKMAPAVGWIRADQRPDKRIARELKEITSERDKLMERLEFYEELDENDLNSLHQCIKIKYNTVIGSNCVGIKRIDILQPCLSVFYTTVTRQLATDRIVDMLVTLIHNKAGGTIRSVENESILLVWTMLQSLNFIKRYVDGEGKTFYVLDDRAPNVIRKCTSSPPRRWWSW